MDQFQGPAATRALVALLFASLPFHRPPVTRALGPALALPELLFLLAAPAVALALVRARVRPEPTGAVLALVLVVGLAPSVLAAGDRPRALVQLAVLVYVALVHQVALAVVALGGRRLALQALVAGAALACALGLGGTLAAWLAGGGHGLAARYPWMPLARPVGLTESPTMLAMVALGGAAAAVALGRAPGITRIPRHLPRLAFGLFAVTLVLAQSRVLLAAVAGLGAALAWGAGAGGTPGRARRVGGVLLLGTALVLLGTSLWLRVVPLRSTAPFVDTQWSPYRVCHDIAWSMFRAHPLAGVGLENFHRAWPAHYQPARHDGAFGQGAEALRGRPLDPHGTVQGYLAEAGLPGLAVVGVVATVLWRRRRRAGAEALGYLVALGCALFFTDVLTERSTFAVLGLLLGTSGAAATTPDSASHSGTNRR